MSARHTLLLENGISPLAFRAAGAKGSSKSSSSSTSTHTDPNTLRSNVRARIIDLISEGEIEEIVGGLKGVFFDRTPVQNEDGSLNFQGVDFDYRRGLADQDELMGNAVTASPFSVGVQVKAATGPVVRTISDRDATAVKVVVTIPSLNLTVDSQKNAGLYKASVSYAFDVKPNGGAWSEAINVTINDKCTSPYQRAHRLSLPAGGFPWQVRMRRISPDSTDDKLQNSTSWDSYIEVVEARLTYMHSAVASLAVDAQQFGQSVPNRSYRVRGIKFQVPSNYDPVARTYSGLWDGTFKWAWTNNPAWVFYGLVTNTRFGLGEFVNAEKLDVAGLYQIAQYCDQAIDDGTDSGAKIPRYTYNGVLNTLTDAHKALQNIAATFRGMSFWSLGQVFAVADMPKDPKILVTKANTIGGFEYSSTAIKARHTVATVSWNDPDDFYRPAMELVHHPEGLRRFGWRQADIVAEGCTNRAQAHYQGLWLLDTEQNETETVVYRASFDHTAVGDDEDQIRGILPGDVVEIADPRRMRVRAGGRTARFIDAYHIEIDGDFETLAGEDYVFKLTMPDGKLAVRQVANISGRVITLVSALPAAPVENATWIISGTQAAPRQFRVMEVAEEAANVFKVTALTFDPQKFDRIEKGLKLPKIAYQRPKRSILPPTNLKAVESAYFRDGVQKSRITLSWTPGADFLSMAFAVTANTPGGFENYGQMGSPVIDIDDVQPGEWNFSVTAVSSLPGVFSEPATITITARGFDSSGLPTIADLQVKGGGSQFSGRSASFTWRAVFQDGAPVYAPDFYVRIFDADLNTLVRTERVSSPAYTYAFEDNLNDGRAAGVGARRRFRIRVSAISPTGAEGAPTALVAQNPAPRAVNLNLSALSEMIVFDCDTPADDDLSGYLVWISETQGFTPRDGEQALDTFIKPSLIKATPGKTYYVRAAAYDAFSRSISDLNLSNEGSIKVTILLFDPVGPMPPEKPTLTTSIEIAPDGTATAVVKATWAADATGATSRYDVAFAQSDASTPEASKGYVLDPVVGQAWEKHGFVPGSTVSVKLRGNNKDGYAGGFSPVATIVAALNLTPPVNISSLRATGGFERAYLDWTGSTSKDAAYVEIWAIDGTSAAAAPPAGAKLLAKVAAASTSYQDATLSTTGTRTYWGRAVNTSGTAATAFAGPASATSAAIQAAQLASGVIDATKMASSLAVPVVVTSLPTTKTSQFVTLQSDGKLYRWDANAGAYTAAVDVGSINASNITGQLTSDQVASIAAAKIAGTLTDAQIATIAAAKITGQISQTQITDGSISTPKLAAGAVVASTIAAGAITASKLTIGTVNRMPCGDFSQGTLGVWQGYNDTGLAQETPSLRTDFAPAGMRAAVVHLVGSQQPPAGKTFSLAFGSWDINSNPQRISVSPGTTYEASAYLSVHRCNAVLFLLFLDASGNLVAAQQSATIPANYAQGGPLKDFPRVGVTFVAPATAVAAYVEIRALTTGGSDPFVFASGIMFGPLPGGTGELSPYADPGVTTIAGGNITTRSISAAAIVAGTITAGEIAARTLTANNIVAGTLTGNEIAANSVNADRIVANSITAAQIAAGAISTGQLAAGAITADKIGVGLSSGNLVWNSDCVVQVANSFTSYTNFNAQGLYTGYNNSGPTWQPMNMGSLQVNCTGTPGSADAKLAIDIGLNTPNADGSFDPWVPCQAGQRYEFSSYISTHRCSAYTVIAFYSADGVNYIEIGSPEVRYNAQASGPLTQWERGVGFATAPSWASRCRVWTRALLNGGQDPYVFTTGFYLAVAQPNQTQPSPWAPQSRTVINGGQVATNSLTADKIVAGSITGDRIAGGTITGGLIAAGTISTGHLAAGTLTADTISVGNGNLASLINGGNSVKIQGGAIAANTITANLLKIGSRQVQLIGISFYMERDGNGNITNVLCWTGGYVLFQNDAGTGTAVNIPAGRVGIDGGYWYVWFNQYNQTLNCARDNWEAIYNDNTSNVLIATVSDLTGISVLVGGTIIDGTRIVTRSIQADQIAANAIQAIHIAANTITGDKIVAGSLAADKIASGTITAGQINIGNDRFRLQSDALLRVFNPINGAEHISMGYVGYWTGDTNDYGLIIRDASNYEIARFCRSGNRLNGAYIDAATIGNAQIANAAINNAKIGNLEVDTIKIANGSVSQVAGAGGPGDVASVGLTVRTEGGRVLIQATMKNDPNQSRTNRNPGSMYIQWDRNGDVNNRQALDETPKNFWLNPGVAYYWGTTTAAIVVTLPAGYHTFHCTTNASGNLGTVIAVTELAK